MLPAPSSPYYPRICFRDRKGWNGYATINNSTKRLLCQELMAGKQYTKKTPFIDVIGDFLSKKKSATKVPVALNHSGLSVRPLWP